MQITPSLKDKLKFLAPETVLKSAILFHTFFNSRKDLHTLRERCEEGAGQRGVVVAPLHVLRPARQLQTSAANCDGSLQGQT